MSGGKVPPQTYFINPALFSYLSRPSFIHRPPNKSGLTSGTIALRRRRALSN